MRCSRRSVALVGVLCCGVPCRRAGAASRFELVVVDAPGVGFNDPTVATPVGGNSGKTIGEQRRIAFQAALAVWGKALDSAVPIRVSASFAPLTCSSGRTVLAQAKAAAFAMNEPGLPPDEVVPIALANRMVGHDLDASNPDIEAEFNGDLSCVGQRWYHGLDGKVPTGADVDLMGVVIHEVAHGLGFLSTVDDETGTMLGGFPDPFTDHILDNSTGKRWNQMTDAERMVSFTNPRHVVWDGAHVTAAAATILARGAPFISFSPSPAALTNTLFEANFGPRLSEVAAAGLTGTGTFITSGDCTVPGSYGGLIPIFTFRVSTCSPLTQVRAAQTGGALAAVLIADRAGTPPPYAFSARLEDIARTSITIPSVLISAEDGALLAAAGGSPTITLSATAAQEVGADAAGRVYLYASDPAVPGSSISHWDPLVRPDLVMEPADTPEVLHDITMERALMIDIGWTPTCGNGNVDPAEQCDSGGANSDTVPDACRTTCTKASCGDGVTDTGEACDNGAANDNTTPDVCRTTCKKAGCGDRVIDQGEGCDDGPLNNDDTPDACRTTCKQAYCGDGVIDQGEACDPGPTGQAANCTPICTLPSKGGCGCGVARDGIGLGATLALLALALMRRSRRREGRAATGPQP